MIHKDILDELRSSTRAPHEHVPAAVDGNGALSRAVFADGAIDTKTKELIAPTVTKQCYRRIALALAALPGVARRPRRSPRHSASPSC